MTMKQGITEVILIVMVFGDQPNELTGVWENSAFGKDGRFGKV